MYRLKEKRFVDEVLIFLNIIFSPCRRSRSQIGCCVGNSCSKNGRSGG